MRVFIGVGSNEGDRLEHISRAVERLGHLPQTRVAQLATINETEPVGGPPQQPYLNTVVELDTGLTPEALLCALQAIEAQRGRRRPAERWGPRPIDLDILLYEGRVIRQPDLIIPHPRMHERRFVLEPLAQLAPDVVHPVLGLTATALLDRLPASALPA
ncbi:MAG: 2-amino-4-hydroxy-6-hydroxymethyldihydropteridine diphosphokinase [Candidatus Omnitrophica bacterium]|nr:2-amino-4-hydroxy-6-hydroxymethyldihydropteridine diphosphokinase [Candidatus Omnitrophota bacterium]